MPARSGIRQKHVILAQAGIQFLRLADFRMRFSFPRGLEFRESRLLPEITFFQGKEEHAFSCASRRAFLHPNGS
jgi:hypothetical protein